MYVCIIYKVSLLRIYELVIRSETVCSGSYSTNGANLMFLVH